MDDDDIRVVKLRGLPWSSTKEDIQDFFNDCKIYKGLDGIHLVTNSSGRSAGEAFVEVPPDDDIDVFLRKDKKSMGHRYIEVFKVKRAEMEWSVRKTDNYRSESRGSDDSCTEDCDYYVRLRGLPYECSKEDIQAFFDGLEIKTNGIQLMVDSGGRSSGEAYVQFVTRDHTEKALGRDKQTIGHRWIEVFKVGPAELKNVQAMASRSSYRSRNSYDRPSPYDRRDRDRSYGGSRYGGNGGGGNNNRSRYDRRDYDDYNDRGGNNYGNSIGSRYYNSGSIAAGEKNCVLMRGLPFKANEYDIRKFFEPLNPNVIDIIYESSGRPSGTAKVVFANGDDVTRAMGKHKERMEHRYIELFLHNT